MAMPVSGNYFQVLGVQPALGRVFNSEEDRAPGASPYVVLSYDYWQSRFQGDPQVLGRKMRLNGYPFSVVGVDAARVSQHRCLRGPESLLPDHDAQRDHGRALRTLEQPQ